MDPLDAIRAAQSTRLVDEDGNEIELELEPGLSDDEIDEVAAEVGAPLPVDLRELLRHTAGFAGEPLDIDFTGRSLSYGDEDIFPSPLPVAGDGFGNFWVLDLTPEGPAKAPVFFASHDPPVVLYQSPDVGTFLHEAFRMLVPPHESAVDDVHEDRLFNVWGENPGTLDHAAALQGDEELRAFASGLDDRFVFVDLRDPPVGMGFSWGRHGPRTLIRRDGHRRLFAYAPPERQPGLLSRLLGR